MDSEVVLKLRNFFGEDKHNSFEKEGGEYWHQDNSRHHSHRAEHYEVVGTKAAKNNNTEYAELNTKLSQVHRQLAEYHQKAATRRK